MAKKNQKAASYQAAYGEISYHHGVAKISVAAWHQQRGKRSSGGGEMTKYQRVAAIIGSKYRMARNGKAA